MILLLLLTLSFQDTFAKDPLQGKAFSSCEKISKHNELKYTVEYMPGNKEFEAELYVEKDKRPCGGFPIFAIGRVWNYEINQNELITTLESVRVIILEPKVVKMFNRNVICGVKNWKDDEVVSCEGKSLLDFEDDIGHRTIHKFKHQKNKLIITDDDGESFELVEEN